LIAVEPEAHSGRGPTAEAVTTLTMSHSIKLAQNARFWHKCLYGKQ
jgi:hypothetical protein